MVNPRFIHYLTGIEKVDDKNRVLLTSLEDIEELMKKEECTNILSLLEKLLTLFKEDTNIENQEMIDVGYPYRAPHVESHNKLIKSFETLGNLFSSGIHNVKYQCSRVKDQAELIYDHIDKNDIPYADWLQKNPTIA